MLNKDENHIKKLYRDILELSNEQWLELLQDSNIFRDKDILLIIELYKCTNCRERAAVLADNLGISSHSVLNLQVGRLGKRIIKKYPKIKFPVREDGSFRYWHIPFWAEDAETNGQFYWELRPELREALKIYLNNQEQNNIVSYNEVIIPQEFKENQILELYEGAKRTITVNAYERNTKARQICINYHGYKCSICNFDFGEFYGDIGFNYIEVHHLKPLHEINKEYQVDPVNDLRPVCPNCHAVLHLSNISCEELKNRLIQKNMQIK